MVLAVVLSPPRTSLSRWFPFGVSPNCNGLRSFPCGQLRPLCRLLCEHFGRGEAFPTPEVWRIAATPSRHKICVTKQYRENPGWPNVASSRNTCLPFAVTSPSVRDFSGRTLLPPQFLLVFSGNLCSFCPPLMHAPRLYRDLVGLGGRPGRGSQRKGQSGLPRRSHPEVGSEL